MSVVSCRPPVKWRLIRMPSLDHRLSRVISYDRVCFFTTGIFPRISFILMQGPKWGTIPRLSPLPLTFSYAIYDDSWFLTVLERGFGPVRREGKDG